MPIVIVVPPLGESVVEATVSKWLKSEGDQVVRDEAVVELETEKINLEVTAFKGGVLAKIAVPEGDTVIVGQRLGVIALEGEKLSREEIERLVGAEQEDMERVGVREERRGEEKVQRPKEVRASPAAKKLAREHGIDLRQVRGSGGSGRIMEKDVLEHVQQLAIAAPSTPRDERVEERIPMSAMRKRIAAHMVQSRQISPHVTTVDEVDMGKIVELRNRFRAAIEEKHGFGLTYLPFIVHAAVRALREYPALNASVLEEAIVERRDVNIGIAVETEKGLVV
ncbi:MAG: dihydrolipoamide acetyltransferase family protein, partial [Dehalococcoidia bacterium]